MASKPGRTLPSAVKSVGDVVNTVPGIEPRAAFGIPVAVALLAFLSSRRVRSFFGATIAGP